MGFGEQVKTIHIVFVGGPECGAVRVLPYPEPVIRIPIPPTAMVATADPGEMPASPELVFHYYMPTGQRDSYKRAIYEYRGER